MSQKSNHDLHKQKINRMTCAFKNMSTLNNCMSVSIRYQNYQEKSTKNMKSHLQDTFW